MADIGPGLIGGLTWPQPGKGDRGSRVHMRGCSGWVSCVQGKEALGVLGVYPLYINPVECCPYGAQVETTTSVFYLFFVLDVYRWFSTLLPYFGTYLHHSGMHTE